MNAGLFLGLALGASRYGVRAENGRCRGGRCHPQPAGRREHVVGSLPVTIHVYENVGKHRVWLKERANVPCRLTSPYFTPRFLSPAVVLVPTFAVSNPPARLNPGATVSCTLAAVVRQESGGGCLELEDSTTPNTCKPSTISVLFGK